MNVFNSAKSARFFTRRATPKSHSCTSGGSSYLRVRVRSRSHAARTRFHAEPRGPTRSHAARTRFHAEPRGPTRSHAIPRGTKASSSAWRGLESPSAAGRAFAFSSELQGAAMCPIPVLIVTYSSPICAFVPKAQNGLGRRSVRATRAAAA